MKTTQQKIIDKEPFELTVQQKSFVKLCERNTCIWCGKRFNDGIILKTPAKIKVSIYEWFTPEFLVHAQTTHGFDPETISHFIDSL